MRPLRVAVASGSAAQLASAVHRGPRPALLGDRAPATGPRYCRGIPAIRSSRGMPLAQASPARPAIVDPRRIPARALAPTPAVRTRANPRSPRSSTPPRRLALRRLAQWAACSGPPPMATTNGATASLDRRSPLGLPSQRERGKAMSIAQRQGQADAAPSGRVRSQAPTKVGVHAASASHSTATTKSPERAWPARRTSRVFALHSGQLVRESLRRMTTKLSRRASLPALARRWRRLPARAGFRSWGGARRWQGRRRYRCSWQVRGRQQPGRAASAPLDRWRRRRDSPDPLRAPPVRRRRLNLSSNAEPGPVRSHSARPMQGSHAQTEDVRDCR